MRHTDSLRIASGAEASSSTTAAGERRLDNLSTWPAPQHHTTTETTRYRTARAASWDRLHPRLTRHTCWIDHTEDLPVIEGHLVRLQVDHLPGDRDPKPVWLWCSALDATATDMDRWWQAFLRMRAPSSTANRCSAGSQ